MLCQDNELIEMWFFLLISALKILALAIDMAAFFALILEKNNGHYKLTFYLDRVLINGFSLVLYIFIVNILVKGLKFVEKTLWTYFYDPVCDGLGKSMVT